MFNSDRLPCVWDNSGNPENLMFDGDGNLVAIDNMITGFDPDQNKATRANFDKFAGNVERLLHDIALDKPNEPHPLLTKIRRLFSHGRPDGGPPDVGAENFLPPSHYDIGEDGVLEMQAGLLEALPLFLELTQERLGALHEEVLAECGGALAAEQAKPARMRESFGAERVNLDFLNQVCAIFRSYAELQSSDPAVAAVARQRIGACAQHHFEHLQVVHYGTFHQKKRRHLRPGDQGGLAVGRREAAADGAAQMHLHAHRFRNRRRRHKAGGQ